MIVKLLTEHHLEFLSLKRGCRGSSESTHVKNTILLEITCHGSYCSGSHYVRRSSTVWAILSKGFINQYDYSTILYAIGAKLYDPYIGVHYNYITCRCIRVCPLAVSENPFCS